jgi:ribosomal protein S18 acetylase RimI-like enzyme
MNSLNTTHTTYRLASPADIPALCDLLAMLFSQEAEFKPDTDAQTRGLGKIISAPNIGRILLAEQSCQVVGMVNLLFTVSTALGERVAILEDLVLLPNVRRQGIGSALIEAAFAQALSDGCHRITLLTDHDNLAGQSFYRKHGFESSSMTPMRKVVSRSA